MPQIDPEKLDPTQFSWFRYIVDTMLTEADGNAAILHSPDSYMRLLNTVTSGKSDDEIQNELIEMVDFHNFECVVELIKRRSAIKAYVKNA